MFARHVASFLLTLLSCAYPAFASSVQTNDVAALQTSANHTTTSSQHWDSIIVGTWYVPQGNLLAYLVGPVAVNPLALEDQTIFQITHSHNGIFSGVVSVRFSDPQPLGWTKATPMYYKLSGLVSPDGKLRITFTPIDSSEPSVTGVGTMEFVQGSYRMTMQMASGNAPYVMHWAYMTKTGTTPPRGIHALASKYDWLTNTHWALTDSQIGHLVFQITDYESGYFFGKGMGSTPVSVVGSVTPEGRLLLALTPQGGTNSMRVGMIDNTNRQWIMGFRSYEGTAETGSALLLHW